MCLKTFGPKPETLNPKPFPRDMLSTSSSEEPTELLPGGLRQKASRSETTVNTGILPQIMDHQMEKKMTWKLGLHSGFRKGKTA